MKNTLRLSLRPNEKLYVNGAVIRVDRKVTVELLNDVQFLLEGHVLQAEDASTPLRQLYFILQVMLMNPQGADEAREMFDGDEAVVQQLLHVFLKDHERTIADLQRAAAHLDYTSLAAVGHSVKGSVGLFCARRAIEAARRLEELAAAQDPQAATGQSQVLVSELKLLAQALRGEVSGRA